MNYLSEICKEILDIEVQLDDIVKQLMDSLNKDDKNDEDIEDSVEYKEKRTLEEEKKYKFKILRRDFKIKLSDEDKTKINEATDIHQLDRICKNIYDKYLE